MRKGVISVGLRIRVIIVTYVAKLAIPKSESMQMGPIDGRPINVHFSESRI